MRLPLRGPWPLAAAVAGRSLVVHTAGPFQQREDPVLLEACIEAARLRGVAAWGG